MFVGTVSAGFHRCGWELQGRTHVFHNNSGCGKRSAVRIHNLRLSRILCRASDDHNKQHTSARGTVWDGGLSGNHAAGYLVGKRDVRLH